MTTISDVVSMFRKEAYWVNDQNTRDVFLTKEKDRDIAKIGVCWVLSRQALREAVSKEVHFVISHENFLYLESTQLWKGYRESRKEKLEICEEHDITVFRLHDAWDTFPEYGVADSLNRISGIAFEKRDTPSLISHAGINEAMSVREIAGRYAKELAAYGGECVEILGDPEHKVRNLASGVGAATPIEEMAKYHADCMVVSDDGARNWAEHQWCLDNDVSLIILHHSVNEMPGMDSLKTYLEMKYPGLEIIRLKEGFRYRCISAEER